MFSTEIWLLISAIATLIFWATVLLLRTRLSPPTLPLRSHPSALLEEDQNEIRGRDLWRG